jgi:hypothetical protein
MMLQATGSASAKETSTCGKPGDGVNKHRWTWGETKILHSYIHTTATATATAAATTGRKLVLFLRRVVVRWEEDETAELLVSWLAPTFSLALAPPHELKVPS